MLGWKDEGRREVSEGIDIVLNGWGQGLCLYIKVVVGILEKKGPAKRGK